MDEKRKGPWFPEHIQTCCNYSRPEIEQHHDKAETLNQHNDTRGDKWDQIGLQELLASSHKKLYDGKSKFQDIKIVEATDIRMYLNDQLQFSSLDERIYHEAFVHIPMALIQKRDRVLILGGGDGLALREILKYRDVKHADLVDLDEQVLEVARDVPAMAALNNRAFHDKRVHVHAQDALKFVKKNHKKYHVIFIDLPDPTVALLAKLYTLELYTTLYSLLEDDGMIVCQSNCTEETPIVFWSICRTLEEAGFHTEPYHTVIPSFGDWGFHLAAKKPFSTHITRIHAPHRTLPKNIATMFQLPQRTQVYKRNAIVNSESHLVLHDIFNRETGNYL